MAERRRGLVLTALCATGLLVSACTSPAPADPSEPTVTDASPSLSTTAPTDGAGGTGGTDGPTSEPTAPEGSSSPTATPDPSATGSDDPAPDPTDEPTPPSPSPTDPPAPSTAQVTVVVAWSGLTDAGDPGASGYAQILEEGGRCVLDLTAADGTTSSSSSASSPDASTTSCGEVAVPAGEAGPGPWQALLHYESATSDGTSPTFEVRAS
ncbi:hypothetical protein [Litorihabitans aurantiacus]|uniref:hypothetical protein n=1 Tax=Litorihabitans aurantiacus TaxID=1930061 RepID=UPI0024E1437A|nr:hypothetical protein [Litorihabitans aurantiacus]